MINKVKRNETPSKVISVENMNKNPKSFSGTSPVQKEGSPLINYKTIYLSDRILLTEKKEPLTEKLLESIESSKFILHQARISHELD